MIRVVQAKDLDVDKWDECVRQSENGLVYSMSWYLDTLGENWDGLVLNDYEMVMPLVHRKKYGLSYLFRPVGVQQIGVTGQNSDRPEVLQEFLNAIPTRFKVRDVFTNSGNVVDDLSADWKCNEQVNLMVDLEDSYEQLYRRFSSNTKRNIKKSQKENFTVFEQDPPEVLMRLFQQNQGKKYSVTSDFYQKMTHLMYVLIHKKLGYVWTVQDDRNTAIAGAFFLEFKGRTTLLFTATSDYGRENHALTFLLNEYFVFKSGHLQCFDFEGSNVPGIRNYYAGFGAREENYFHLRNIRLPGIFRRFF